MNLESSAAPEPVLLIIADISGYTRFMTANAKTLAHSQSIITELVKSLIEKIELPFEVAKLEGDAIFFFCRKQHGVLLWSEARLTIGAKLLTFFRIFSDKLGELSRSTTCTCQACKHIEHLRLKVIVHSGEVLFHRVLNFVELAGVNVILIHRLLKNSVHAHQYLLLTEAVRRDLEFPAAVQFAQGAETYADLGRVNTLVYLPDGEAAAVCQSATASFARRFSQSWTMFCRLWFAPFALRPGSFHHVVTQAGTAGKLVFAIFTALFTPVILPVGTVFVFLHALKGSPKVRPAQDAPRTP